MAAHTVYPPTGAEALVRGDPAAFVVRFRVDGVDQNITTWTWRSHVRDQNDVLITECLSFTVSTPDALPDLFPTEGGTTPCVLLANWTAEDTKNWHEGLRADIEQLTPNKRTWLIFDHLRVDQDASFSATTP